MVGKKRKKKKMPPTGFEPVTDGLEIQLRAFTKSLVFRGSKETRKLGWAFGWAICPLKLHAFIYVKLGIKQKFLARKGVQPFLVFKLLDTGVNSVRAFRSMGGVFVTV